MTTKTIAGILAVAACGATLAMTSCDSTSTSPGASANEITGGSKSPNVLTECASIFTGIENCTIGATDLAAVAGIVRVTGFGADGEDGVSSSFPDAMDWSQRATESFGARTGASINFAAISDGQAVSELHIARGEGATFHFTPTFTAADGASSRFHVHVYNDGLLLGGEEGINPNTPVFIYGSGDDDRDGGDRRRKFRPRPHQQQRAAGPDWQTPGACEWSHATMEPGATFSVHLPNGTILDGDEVLFTEEVAAGQAVYNNFQRIDVTGNLESYTITEESSVPAE